MKRLPVVAGFLLISALLVIRVAATLAADELSGKVIETMNSGGYTYALIEKGDKKIWVAVPKTKITKGQTVTFLPGNEMVNFSSKTLNRTFDKIIFSGGVAEGGPSQGDSTSAGSKGAVSAPAEKVKVEKASGADAYTVEEIYKNAQGLDKKKVSVKGKIVKVSSGIMNMNWLHLQDGSGDPKKGSHDLVVTTADRKSVV